MTDVFFFSIDCVVKASPACKRAVLETVEALRKQGHECVELDVGSYGEYNCVTAPDLEAFMHHLQLHVRSPCSALFLQRMVIRLCSLIWDLIRRSVYCCPYAHLNTHGVVQDESLFLVTLGPSLPCWCYCHFCLRLTRFCSPHRVSAQIWCLGR